MWVATDVKEVNHSKPQKIEIFSWVGSILVDPARDPLLMVFKSQIVWDSKLQGFAYFCCS